MKNRIYIGDNLDILNNSCLDDLINKIGVIYIDPPYNNGTSFSYNNSQTSEDWAFFMEQRLKSAYRLMADSSAIFISIDDSEFVSLRIVLDKVFGKNNFVGTFITRQSQRSNAKHINTIHEYVVCYAKNKTLLPEFIINRMSIPEDRTMIEKLNALVTEELKTTGYDSAYKLLQKAIKSYCQMRNITWLKNYNNIDESGRIYFAKDLSTPGKPRTVNIPSINLHLEPLETRGWSSDKKFIALHNEKRLVFKGSRPYEKHYLEEAQDSTPSILNFYSRQGTNALKKLGLHNLFDTPKPVELIKFIIRACCKHDTYVLDFFAGSGTTAQAVYEINEEDNVNHKYILIQLDEEINPKSPVYAVCKQRNIIPKMQYVLKYRIDKYLESTHKSIDYDFYDA